MKKEPVPGSCRRREDTADMERAGRETQSKSIKPPGRHRGSDHERRVGSEARDPHTYPSFLRGGFSMSSQVSMQQRLGGPPVAPRGTFPRVCGRPMRLQNEKKEAIDCRDLRSIASAGSDRVCKACDSLLKALRYLGRYSSLSNRSTRFELRLTEACLTAFRWPIERLRERICVPKKNVVTTTGHQGDRRSQLHQPTHIICHYDTIGCRT